MNTVFFEDQGWAEVGHSRPRLPRAALKLPKLPISQQPTAPPHFRCRFGSGHGRASILEPPIVQKHEVESNVILLSHADRSNRRQDAQLPDKS